MTAKVKAHAYDPSPTGTTRFPPCTCGMTIMHRSHQPWWWRLTHPGVNWR